MVETYCSTAALAATMPPVSVQTENIELKLLYDPFKPETVETHELDYQDGKWLSDYLGDMPADAEFMVFFNGEEIDQTIASVTPVGPGDRIGVVMMPMGGDGFKSILRIGLQIASVAAAVIPGVGWIAAIAINVAIGLINAFLLTPKGPKSQDQEERSYGIDGAKNSATEGIVYPVVYGEYRVAGNFSDTYTENVGDNQFLYLRCVLNDGLIDSVTDIEVNEQALSTFKQVQTRIKLGSLTEDVNDWFRSSIRQVNKGVKFTDTGWLTHVTTQSVDQVRFDVVFPTGLVSINAKKGDYKSKSVKFEMEYRQVEESNPGVYVPVAGAGGLWGSMPHSEASVDQLDFLNNTILAPLSTSSNVVVQATTPTLSINPLSLPGVEYRTSASSPWSRVDYELASQRETFIADSSADGTIAGPTNITPRLSSEMSINVPAGDLEIRGVGGAQLARVTTYPTSGQATATVSDRRTRALRRSFTSQRLANAFYEVRIRRTSAPSTNQYEIDEVHLSDVAEIEADPVALRGTANLSLRIKLNEQLSNIPQLTCKVKGCLVQKYDIDGTPTVFEWSANPAWIGLDIICGEARGALMPLSRIDFPKWIELAEYCDVNNITFNGVFAEVTNIGDALRQVLRIGHAAPIPFGTKVSVAIDAPRDPVTVFTQASMIAKSFQVTYMAMRDRANEFDVTYYDKTDRNKAKTIRYVDPKAVTFNEMPRSAGISLVGVDNIEQARAELWRMIYANRLIIRSVTFDTFMESINLSVGEVALIQHDQMEWANNGRLAAANTATQLRLDQAVEMIGGTSYSALVHFSAIKRTPTSRTVNSVVGNRVLINSGSVNLTTVQLGSKRLVATTGEDYEIAKIENGGTYHTITLTEAPTGIAGGSLVDLFNTDVLEERPVASVAQNLDGTSTVTLSSALTAIPDQYASFVYGKVESVRKPFVLTGVSGAGIEKRKLTFMEYHEGVYGPPEVDIPIPVQQVNDRNVDHVQGLLFDYERLIGANKKTCNVRVFWNAAAIRNYGGADVYMRLNGGEWSASGSAYNVSEYNLQLTPDDNVEFRVVAYSNRGDRASAKTAPTVSGTLVVSRATLDTPTAFSAIVTSFEVEGTVAYAWTAPADATGVEGYEVEVRQTADANWFSLGRFSTPTHVQSGLPTGDYLARVRSISTDSISDWVETGFTVTVLPGSIMANFQGGNDRNGDPIGAPTLPVANAVEHTTNTDGSANVSLEWLWAGDEAEIDGFQIKVTQT